MVLMLIYLDE